MLHKWYFLLKYKIFYQSGKISSAISSISPSDSELGGVSGSGGGGSER